MKIYVRAVVAATTLAALLVACGSGSQVVEFPVDELTLSPDASTTDAGPGGFSDDGSVAPPCSCDGGTHVEDDSSVVENDATTGDDASVGVDSGYDSGQNTDSGNHADGGRDSGSDAGTSNDAGSDSGSDAGLDGGSDGGSSDGGKTCEEAYGCCVNECVQLCHKQHPVQSCRSGKKCLSECKERCEETRDKCEKKETCKDKRTTCDTQCGLLAKKCMDNAQCAADRKKCLYAEACCRNKCNEEEDDCEKKNGCND